MKPQFSKPAYVTSPKRLRPASIRKSKIKKKSKKNLLQKKITKKSTFAAGDNYKNQTVPKTLLEKSFELPSD